MNQCIKNIQKFLLLMIVALYSSCFLLTAAKKKLNTYCPGLAIEISGVSIGKSTAFNLSTRTASILSYDSGDEQTIKDYFSKPALGYKKVENNNFFKKEIDDDKFIEDNDDVVGKTIKSGKIDVVIMFNQTKESIIILEYEK